MYTAFPNHVGQQSVFVSFLHGQSRIPLSYVVLVDFFLLELRARKGAVRSSRSARLKSIDEIDMFIIV